MRRYLTKEIKRKGVTQELHSISFLAQELGRVTQTVRKWEKQGLLPKTKYVEKSGRRFYSREQIDSIKEILLGEGGIVVGSKHKIKELRSQLKEAM